MDQCSSWQWSKLKRLGSDKYRRFHMCPKPTWQPDSNVSGFDKLSYSHYYLSILSLQISEHCDPLSCWLSFDMCLLKIIDTRGCHLCTKHIFRLSSLLGPNHY